MGISSAEHDGTVDLLASIQVDAAPRAMATSDPIFHGFGLL